MAKKYIDAVRLKAEIAKLRKEHTTREYRDEAALVLDDLEDYIDSLQQEQPSIPDLDEAAEKWCKENNKGIALCDDKKSHYLVDGTDAFIAGAEWQKEQMLKEAVEGFVATHLTSEGTKVTVNSGYLPKEMCIKPGDKVRIIIVKEER